MDIVVQAAQAIYEESVTVFEAEPSYESAVRCLVAKNFYNETRDQCLRQPTSTTR